MKAKVPIIMIVGKKEVENKTISIRKIGNEKSETFKTEQILMDLYKQSLGPNSKD